MVLARVTIVVRVGIMRSKVRAMIKVRVIIRARIAARRKM